MLRPSRLSVPLCTVLRGSGLLPFPAPPQEHEQAHRVVTSPSIRAVYFSNARVSSENWMIRSCP